VSAARAILTICCLVSLGSGCSVKMMYNNADRFARWAVNDYIKMDDAQEAYFTAEVDAIHYWHRTEELPLYADYLDSLPGAIDDGVDEADIQGTFDTFYSWWESLEAKAMPMMVDMLLSLSDEQVERLPERLAKDNEEFSEDERDRPLEEVQAEWMKSYSDAMARFSGRLTKEQKAYLSAQSVRYVPQFELWADYRQRWQQDLVALLIEGREDPEEFAEAFVALIHGREAYYGKELTAVFDANEQLAREVTAWLLNNLTDEQRERFYTRIGEMAVAFRELAADVPDQVPEGGGCLVRCG
jgi:class 3 adenylate cyclase